MNATTISRLQLVLAAIQALGAVFGTLAYFSITSASLSRVIGWVLATTIGGGIAFIVYSRLRDTRHGVSQPRADGADDDLLSRPPTEHSSTLRSLLVHRLVTLTVWSMLASSVIIYMSSYIAGFLIVGLAPLWVCTGSFAATRLTAGHRTSAIILGGLLCGFFGAWLGSVGNEGTQLGFVWGCMAGGLVASYFAGGNAQMSLLSSLLSTVVFVGFTAAVVGSDLGFILRNTANFVQAGFPLLMIESMLLLAGYLLPIQLKFWRRVSGRLADERRPTRPIERTKNRRSSA